MILAGVLKFLGDLLSSRFFWIGGGLIAAWLYVGHLQSAAQTAEAEKVKAEAKVAATTADLLASQKNALRMAAEKDDLIATLARSAESERERAEELQQIMTGIADAKDSNVCVGSPAIDSVLRSLRRGQAPAGGR